MRLKPAGASDTPHRADIDAGHLRHHDSGPVGRPGGRIALVGATTRSVTSAPSGEMREGRVLSRNRPSKPSSLKRSYQSQAYVFDLAVRRMISLESSPWAVSNTIRARQTCFCAALWSLIRA